MDIGITIKRLREAAGLQQNELAERAGVSQSYLSLIERNQKDATISTLRSIAAGLDIPLPALLFISMDESDVASGRAESFRTLFPSIRALVEQTLIASLGGENATQEESE